MKKLLLLSVATLSFAGVTPAFAQSVTTESSAVSEFLLEVKALQVQSSLYSGDFQSLTRQSTSHGLHTGQGASLMMSIVMARD